MLSRIVVTLLALYTVSSQNPSPCPEILVYEPKTELDRWYGVVTLSSNQQLKGIWLRITLDRPAELLGNIFGDASTDDNLEFLIRSQNYILEAGKTTTVRFFVKFNKASIIPSVTEINLNGRMICSSANPQTTRRTTATRPTSSTNRIPTTASSSSNPRIIQTTQRATAINRATTLANTVVISTNFSNNRAENNRPRNPSSPSNNNRPTSPSNNLNTHSNERPANNRPNRTDVNNRPSSTFSDIDAEIDNYRPSGSSSANYNIESDNYDSDYNNGNNRPGLSFGANREPDTTFNQQSNYYNQEDTAFGVPTSQGNNDEFFSGDFSAVVNRPPPNSIRITGNRNEQCGRVSTKASPLIAYGQNTVPGQWPWHAALYHSKGIQLMYTCGGTLITTRHILTAAHCVTRPHTKRAINPQNLVVYLGKYNLRKFGSEIQDKEVIDIYVHPEYNYTVYHNDIAILRLGEPAQITNHVRTVCLWNDVEDLNQIEGRHGTVVGWGFDHNRQLSTTLMQAQMPVVPTLDCIYSNTDFFSQFTSKKSFCAGFKNGTSVCNGDSGGGMVFPKRGTTGSNTVWQIRGLVSVGVALQGQGVCDPSQYIVFTDVAKHLDWIQQILVNYP